MTAKQYLQKYRYIEGNYNAALEEYKSVEQDMITLKSPNFEEYIPSGAKNDPIGDMVIKLEQQRANIGMKIVKYRSQMLVIRTQISEMEPINNDFCLILLMRYVLHKDWKFVCNNLNVSRAQANIVHGKALTEFDKKFGGKYDYL